MTTSKSSQRCLINSKNIEIKIKQMFDCRVV